MSDVDLEKTDRRYVRLLVDVAPAHLDRQFEYAVPEDADLEVGNRVQVTFNGRTVTAWVCDVDVAPTVAPERIRLIDSVDGRVSWFDHDDLQTWRWVADRFAGTQAAVARAALPKRIIRVEQEMSVWTRPSLAHIDDAAQGEWTMFGDVTPHSLCAEPGATHLRAPLHPVVGEGPFIADLVAATVTTGKQAIVVVPSPAQGVADDVTERLGGLVTDVRGTTRDADRYRAFLRFRTGATPVVIGERSVALWPAAALGLIVVVDEASPAYKSRREPRHHVREAVLGRGVVQRVPVVLTSSLLSAAAYRHATGGHLRLLRPSVETMRRSSPHIEIVDRRQLSPSARTGRIVDPVMTRLRTVVEDSGNAIVVAAGKGSGSSLACKTCRNRLECPSCGGGIAYAKNHDDHLECRSCGWVGTTFVCPDCGGTHFVALRAGAKRLSADLSKSLFNGESERVSWMEGFDQSGPSRRPGVAVMTRGSIVERPRWLHGEHADLVVLADPDTLLGRPDVAAAEDALRLWCDAARIGTVLVGQSSQSDHPAFQALLRHDPDSFWNNELQRRAPLGFPPVGTVIVVSNVTADAVDTVRNAVGPARVLGPDQDNQALVFTDDLWSTLNSLRPLREVWGRDNARIRVDVDPVVF